MRIVFAGTPAFAQSALAALHQAGHDIALVLTQPDRPAGRGMKLQASAVKQYALQHGWPVCQPTSLRLDGPYPDDALLAQQAIANAHAELMVVVAYGLLLPAWTLQSVPRGCLNIHASLLPRWRGAAPIQRAIEAGDTHTGVCIMHMDEGLDTGAVLLREALPIASDDTSITLHDKLAALGARLVVQTLAQLPRLQAVPQATEGATYAAKILKHEALIDWSLPASQLSQRIRAFDPFPGAHTLVRGQALKIWSAQAEASDTTSAAASASSASANQVIASNHVPPGTVVQAHADQLLVATGLGHLRITQVQLPGGKRISAADWLHSHAGLQGLQLGV
jgi:methionyl-tRNA formyltransferase